jgi:hypothetical protein
MAFGIYVYVCMRTTLILDDQLIRRAKREAGDKGSTLSELVNRALRNYFFTKPDEGKQVVFTMPVFGEAIHLHQTARQLAELRDEGR